MKAFSLISILLLSQMLLAQRIEAQFPTDEYDDTPHMPLDNISSNHGEYMESLLFNNKVKPDLWSTPCNDGVYPVCWVPPDTSTMPIPPTNPPCCWKCNKGMTMKVIQHETCLYIDYVRCNGTGCNWSVGDTPCYLPLPVLCVQKHNLPDPGFSEISGCCRWLGGDLRLTEPIQGCALTSKAAADKICAVRFGCGWEMADYHTVDYDGMVGHGNLNATPWVINYFSWLKFGKFWVAHTHNPANCWNSV